MAEQRWCATCESQSPVTVDLRRDAWRCHYCKQTTTALEAIRDGEL